MDGVGGDDVGNQMRPIYLVGRMVAHKSLAVKSIPQPLFIRAIWVSTPNRKTRYWTPTNFTSRTFTPPPHLTDSWAVLGGFR
jgi:hypothetical protein